jgi:polyisoprenoid-binding protein YceI
MADAIPGYVAGTWDLDPVHSHIGFAARHLMVSKVRGHFGKFNAPIPGGVMVSEKVSIEIEAEAVLRKPE